MKIAIISDLHLGFRQYGSIEREEDFYKQFSSVIHNINEKEVDMVIIAGDLFNTPNPSPAAINAYREGITSLSADIICTIKGNHTMVLRGDHFSIDEFFEGEEILGYYYLDDCIFNTQIFSLEGGDAQFRKYKDTNVHVDGITYRSNSDIDEFLEIQKELSKGCSKDDYNILVVHQSFKEFCGFIGEELSIEDINYKPYDVVICGHIHSRMHTKLSDGTWFIQPGSIERMNTTEALDEQKNGKGFYLLDTKTNELEFYPVECPRKFFLGEIKINSEEDLEKHVEGVKKAIEKSKVPPIISYKYYNFIDNIDGVREKVGLNQNHVLLNKSNIDDRSEDEVVLEITDEEMPTVLEAINMYGEKSGLDEKGCALAIDLHKALNENEESVSGILENFLEKNKKKYNEEIFKDDDLDEIIEYFGG